MGRLLVLQGLGIESHACTERSMNWYTGPGYGVRNIHGVLSVEVYFLLSWIGGGYLMDWGRFYSHGAKNGLEEDGVGGRVSVLDI